MPDSLIDSGAGTEATGEPTSSTVQTTDAPSSPPTPAAWRDGVLSADGEFLTGWTEKLPDDLKAEAPTLSRFPKFQDLAQSYVQLRKRMSEKVPTYPDAEATPEQVQAWRQIAGIPESAEEYELKPPDKLPEGMTADPQLIKDFASKAHELNIHPSAAQQLAEWWTERQGAGIEMARQSGEANDLAESEKLHNAWGNDFTMNSRKAKLAAATIGLDLADPRIGMNAGALQALAKMADLLSEDKLVAPEMIGMQRGGKEAALDIIRNPGNPLHKAYYGEEGDERQKYANGMVQAYFAQG